MKKIKTFLLIVISLLTLTLTLKSQTLDTLNNFSIQLPKHYYSDGYNIFIT